MSTEPQPDSQSDLRRPLPFEPGKSRKKTEKKSAVSQPAVKADAATSIKPGRPSRNKAETAIPDVVSRRMAKRMAWFCGIPSLLGISTFLVSYFLISNDVVVLPNVAVVLVSMGFFGLGVLGLSYGVISASWDEEVSGSSVGWSEFTTNLGRLTGAWQSARREAVAARESPAEPTERSPDKKS